MRFSLPLRFLLALVLTAAVAAPATAQNSGDGSIYSRFGLGELQSFGSSQVQAFGGNGVGLRSYSYVNFDNPATWSDQVLTRLAAGVQYQGVTITDAADRTSRVGQGGLNAVQLAFPILRQRLGVGVAFQPFSRVGYRVREEGQLYDPVRQDSTTFNVDFEGTGGLQEVQAGLGYRLSPNLRVGASVSWLFGIIETGRRTSFIDNAFEETNLKTATRMNGFTGTAGVFFEVPRLAGENDALSLGATFRLPTTLDGERLLTLGESLDRDTLGVAFEGTADLPLSAEIGASYRANEHWIFNAGGLYEPWGAFSSDLSLPPGNTDTYRDRVRASAGLEYFPAGRAVNAPFYERTAYRLGVYYDRAYVAPVAGIDLRTLALTGGFSLPALIPGTRLDINWEVGTRGTTDRGLVQDRYYRLGATVNVGERWFDKQKLR